MIESITFDTANNRLIYVMADRQEFKFTGRIALLAMFPKRSQDADAMGWN